MTGMCQNILPFLLNPLALLGLTGLGIGAALLYRISAYTFIPKFLSFYMLSRIAGSIASIINLAWRANIFIFLALATTFSKTLAALYNGTYNGLLDIVFIGLTEIYTKIGLSVNHLVEGIGLIGEWLVSSNSLCSLLSTNELLLTGLYELWIALAAYIFAIRLYDWLWGKGMTRDIEWPEVMLVVVVVTLFSVLIGVYQGGLIENASTNTQILVDGLTGVNETVSGNVTK